VRRITDHEETSPVMSVYDCADTEQRTAGLAAARTALQSGELVVMPTDTLYGIGCDAFDSTAVDRLLRAKGRGRDMPVPVLIGSWAPIDGLVSVVTPPSRDLPGTSWRGPVRLAAWPTIDGLVSVGTAQMRDLTRAFWPGALSLVVAQAPSLAWDLGDAHGTVMLRMPLHPVALELLRAHGPMAVSSANVSGRAPAATMADARTQLGGAVSVYLDGGPSEHAVASTIVDVSAGAPRILREGAVAAER